MMAGMISSRLRGVAVTAGGLAKLAGFSPAECRAMEVAGLLHDLGKLAVANEIIEKPSGLSDVEFNVIRSHAFYTHRSLQPLEKLKTINTWAALHHERLDGSSYPFHLKDKEIPSGARIIAVADVFTALTEDRPYRQGVTTEKVKPILWQMADKRKLDKDLVARLETHSEEMDGLRHLAQQTAAAEFHRLATAL